MNIIGSARALVPTASELFNGSIGSRLGNQARTANGLDQPSSGTVAVCSINEGKNWSIAALWRYCPRSSRCR
jgi:hypothetical protein